MTRSLRLLIVSTTLNTGGAQRVTSTLLRHFDRRRVRPSLALLRPDIGYPLPDDVPVYHLGYRGVPSFPATVKRLRGVVEGAQPDVVLSNVNATNLITGWALSSLGDPPRWVARMGAHPAENDLGLRRLIAPRAYAQADCVVANSRGLASAVARHYPWLAPRIDHIANPTDFEAVEACAAQPKAVASKGEHPVIVAVGRLFRPKRYDVMLEAFAIVRARMPCELWVCGDGPERRKLERLARRLGLGGWVRWLGFVENPYAVMRQSDLFLMTSEYEGLPNALIEAQGLGLPAVSTACPHGPDEIIEDGVTGHLVEVGDVTSIADAVATLLADRERVATMSDAAPSRMRAKFALESLVQAWERLLAAAPLPEGASGEL